MAALLFQFVGAVIANRVQRRRAIFMTAFITSRALCVPTILVPLLFPEADIDYVMTVVLLLIAVRAILSHIASPLFFSWMADLVPHRVLNRYWSSRQMWMTATWALCYLGTAAYTKLAPWDVQKAYPPLVILAVAAGIIDILLFAKVDEPPNHTAKDLPVLHTLLAPLRDGQYRTFVMCGCLHSASMIIAGAFIQLYCLKVLGMALWQVILMWCLGGTGNALAAKFWGRMADRHGHKPIMAMCSFFKPVIVIVFLFATPRTALWVFAPIFMLDGVWNSGYAVAANGFMMKIAPKRNRSMFIAAFIGLAGVCGGLAAMLGGVFLEYLGGVQFEFMGRSWGNYQLLFVLSSAMRVMSAVFVHRLHEPTSSHPVHVLNDIRGVWLFRFRRFPVGLYRRWNVKADNDD